MLFDSEIDRAVRGGTPLTETGPWKALQAHYREMGSVHMRELFAADPDRFGRFSIELEDLLFDYSKNRVTGDTVKLLLDLARASGVVEVGLPPRPSAPADETSILVLGAGERECRGARRIDLSEGSGQQRL